MKTHDCYRLHITPLSPVHIGTGESYEPTNYVIEDEVLHEFDTGSVVDALTAKDREGLLAIANRKPDTEMIKALQRFFHERRAALKPWAVNRIPVLPGVASLYASRVGQAAQHEGDGAQVLNRLEIDRTAYSPTTRRPVLFGSSVKGAIRTALLDQVNGGQRAHETKGLHKFQGRLFHYRDPESERLSLERDPMRLVQLADSHWQGDAALPSAQVHLAVNRKKAPVLDKKTGQLAKAMGENLYQILECVAGWQYRSFSGQISVRKVDGISQQSELPNEEMRFSIQAIAHACNRFYLPILTGERTLLCERRYINGEWDRSVQRALEIAEAKIQRGDTFLLRVGRHSGAESVTVSGARNGNIRIMKGKGQPPEFADAAKTLWLAADTKDQRSGLLPFGWLLVEIQPLDGPEQDWPELKALCEPHLEQARAFAARLEQQAEKLAQARAQAERRRLEDAEQARKKAEEEVQKAREEAERQARWEAMSENARQVENLKVRMGPANKGRRQSDQLYQQTNQLIKSAVTWSTEDRQALKTVAVTVFEHLGLKKDDYKKLIRDLATS